MVSLVSEEEILVQEDFMVMEENEGLIKLVALVNTSQDNDYRNVAGEAGIDMMMTRKSDSKINSPLPRVDDEDQFRFKSKYADGNAQEELVLHRKIKIKKLYRYRKFILLIIKRFFSQSNLGFEVDALSLVTTEHVRKSCFFYQKLTGEF
jgi:hypothetical protein